MSSLIYITDEIQAMISMDTLATRPDGSPLFFTSKAMIVPHLRMVIAGTGAGGFADSWFVMVNSRRFLFGVDDLHQYTPEALRSLWAEFQKAGFRKDFSTTVYHFGFSEQTGLLHTYAYRSADNFVGERMGYGVGVKPECAVTDGQQYPACVRGMMDEQRAIQAKVPHGQRLYVGGEICVYHLTKHGISTWMEDRFEDYEANQAAMIEGLQKQPQGSDIHST